MSSQFKTSENTSLLEAMGEIIKVLPVQTITGIKGDWSFQNFIIADADNSRRTLCFSITHNSANKHILKEENLIKIKFEIESKLYKGKWYTNLYAKEIESLLG